MLQKFQISSPLTVKTHGFDILLDILKFGGVKEVQHQAKQFVKKKCRKISWYTYSWKQGKKFKTVLLSDINCSFIIDTLAFDLKYYQNT